MKVLVTCPPMLGLVHEFATFAADKGLELVPARVTQTLSEAELERLLPHVDGWIIGDDPATRRVLLAGRNGMLKAAVKWGIGVDNVDLEACRDLGIPISNTPFMFGEEVADVALSYLIGLARGLYFVNHEIRTKGTWPKPAGISLRNKKVGLVGFGDIGANLAKRLTLCGMKVTIYDPGVHADTIEQGLNLAGWPKLVETMDFLVFTCSLNEKNHHMLNRKILGSVKPGVFIVNVARGPLIDEVALVDALESGLVAGAALDVFEAEPLPKDSKLRSVETCVFGSHNSSNTKDAVRRASYEAISKLAGFLYA